jgi:hypothetical protein
MGNQIVQIHSIKISITVREEKPNDFFRKSFSFDLQKIGSSLIGPLVIWLVQTSIRSPHE